MCRCGAMEGTDLSRRVTTVNPGALAGQVCEEHCIVSGILAYHGGCEDRGSITGVGIRAGRGVLWDAGGRLRGRLVDSS